MTEAAYAPQLPAQRPVHDDCGDAPPTMETTAVATLQSDRSGMQSVQYVRANYGLRGEGQTVAVIDSGIAYDHYALGAGLGAKYRVVGGWDFAENDANPYDDAPAGFHGTHVAGIIGGNYRSFQGVAPAVDFVSLRVFDDAGSGSFQWVEQALQWVHAHRNAFEHPITTVNMSIGANWNAESTPGWSQIEDELRQLKADGIFISVAAGNGFAKNQAAGLSYPAASPSVVPVASVNADGLMSDFSQRSSRVMAAPGSNINSAVPDYFLGADGIPNDFYTASGTSMAAPYVAGAAVLVREAMQRSLFATAGQSALGNPRLDQDAILDKLRETADPVFDRITGTTYARINLGRAIDSILQPQTIELGTVSVWSGKVDTSGTAPAWYEFRADRSGLVTLESSDSSTTASSMQLVDGSGNEIGTHTMNANGDRIDADVVAGNTYRVAIRNAAADTQLKITNLVSVNGSRIEVAGTEGVDSVSIATGEVTTVTVVGTSYRFTGTTQWVISGGTGRDSLQISGTSANESLTIREDRLQFRGTNVDIVATDFESIQVQGNGGRDSANLIGTAANDVAEIRAGSARLDNTNLAWIVQGFQDVAIDAGTSGTDTATLFDSAGNNTLIMERRYSLLEGSGYRAYVSGFDQVDANASNGLDSVRFVDSTGNDQFQAGPGVGTMSGTGYQNTARGFAILSALSRSGGADTVRLTASNGDDTLERFSDRTRLAGPGFEITVSGFATISVDANQRGRDTAKLFDSPGNDTLIMEPAYSSLRGSGYYIYATGFEEVDAYSTGGNDTARLFDSTGNDQLRGTVGTTTFSGATFRNTARGFATVVAYARAGGHDTATLLDSAGNDAFVGNGRNRSAALNGTGYAINTWLFESVVVQASTGFDIATLVDSSGDDVYTAAPGTASMSGVGYAFSATGFDQCRGQSTFGGNDVARLFDSAGDDQLSARLALVEFAGKGFRNTASGFANVSVFASNGGYDTAQFESLRKEDYLSGRGRTAQTQRGREAVSVTNFDRILAAALDQELFSSDVTAVDYLFEQIGGRKI